jgi:prophage regulatory protein
MEEVLRTREVLKITKFSRSTLWRLERQGRFPRRRKLSDRAVGWFRSEVEGWLAEREPISGATRQVPQ